MNSALLINNGTKSDVLTYFRSEVREEICRGQGTVGLGLIAFFSQVSPKTFSLW